MSNPLENTVNTCAGMHPHSHVVQLRYTRPIAHIMIKFLSNPPYYEMVIKPYRKYQNPLAVEFIR